MKRNFLMKAFVCLFTVVALCSCSKDDDDENDNAQIPYNSFIAVENGASYNEKIDVVKVVTDDKAASLPNSVLYSTLYENGGFKLKLPESVSDQFLEGNDGYHLVDTPGVAISNPNVKIVYIYLHAYNKSGWLIGDFYHGTEEWDEYFIYSDSDCNITGSYTDTYPYYGITYTDKSSYNVYLKKGWNMVYEKETDKGNNSYEYEYTTQVPTGAKWYFDEWERD